MLSYWLFINHAIFGALFYCHIKFYLATTTILLGFTLISIFGIFFIRHVSGLDFYLPVPTHFIYLILYVLFLWSLVCYVPMHYNVNVDEFHLGTFPFIMDYIKHEHLQSYSTCPVFLWYFFRTFKLTMFQHKHFGTLFFYFEIFSIFQHLSEILFSSYKSADVHIVKMLILANNKCLAFNWELCLYNVSVWVSISSFIFLYFIYLATPPWLATTLFQSTSANQRRWLHSKW